ncbi:MAG: hypothetical protein CME65_05650 [Halobacteriovoraceae bacterium]|nr:hypothetical protein [Halobacteriovoraceae bacterium]|tara:strand:- start:5422 stop:6192 length:771 start_codon:yes stop_codon:yes gene_type:complete
MKNLFFICCAIVLGGLIAHQVSGSKSKSLIGELSDLVPKEEKRAINKIKIVNIPKVSIKSNEREIKKITKCLKDEKCLKKDKRFHDPALSPDLTKVSSRLQALEVKLNSQQKDISEIDQKLLREVLEFKHKSSFSLASTLLMRADPNNIENIGQIKFEGKEVGLFFDLFEGRNNLTSRELDVLNNKVEEFIGQDDYTFLKTLEELNNLALTRQQWDRIRDLSCGRLQRVNRYKNLYNKKIERVGRKLSSVSSGCSR